MKNITRTVILVIMAALLITTVSVSVFADDTVAVETAETAEVETAAEETKTDSSLLSVKAIVAGTVILVVAGIGAVSMAIAVGKSADGTARQPEAAGNIRTTMMMGLIFIETAIIYALIIAILIIFVL